MMPSSAGARLHDDSTSARSQSTRREQRRRAAGLRVRRSVAGGPCAQAVAPTAMPVGQGRVAELSEGSACLMHAPTQLLVAEARLTVLHTRCAEPLVIGLTRLDRILSTDKRRL